MPEAVTAVFRSCRSHRWEPD